MKFLPKLNRVGSSSQSSGGAAQRQSFGQARSEKMNRRLQQATAERQKLRRAEQAAIDAPKPVQQTLKQRGELVERRIARLQKDEQF